MWFSAKWSWKKKNKCWKVQKKFQLWVRSRRPRPVLASSHIFRLGNQASVVLWCVGKQLIKKKNRKKNFFDGPTLESDIYLKKCIFTPKRSLRYTKHFNHYFQNLIRSKPWLDVSKNPSKKFFFYFFLFKYFQPTCKTFRPVLGSPSRNKLFSGLFFSLQFCWKSRSSKFWRFYKFVFF